MTQLIGTTTRTIRIHGGNSGTLRYIRGLVVSMVGNSGALFTLPLPQLLSTTLPISWNLSMYEDTFFTSPQAFFSYTKNDPTLNHQLVQSKVYRLTVQAGKRLPTLTANNQPLKKLHGTNNVRHFINLAKSHQPTITATI